DDNALTALNTAFVAHGAFVHVPRDVVLDRPVHLVHVASAGGEGFVAHPRTLVVADAQSQVTIVEHFVGHEDDVYFTNAVTEIVAGESSVLHHCKVLEESREAFHIANTQLVLARNSQATSTYVSLGGGLVRNEVRVLFGAEGGEATLNGLYL